jgi:Na+/proline symporter
VGLFLVAIGVLLAFRLQKVATALTMLLGFQSIMGVIVWGGVIWRRANPGGAWSAFILMLTVWSLLGPVAMLSLGSKKAAATKPTTMMSRAESDIEPAASWLPKRLGQYGDEKLISQLMVWSLPAGVLGLVIGSLVTRPLPRKQVDDFFMLLKTPVGQEQKLIDAGVPIIYAGNTIANPLEVNHPRLVHWGGFALAAAACVGILGLLCLLAWLGS